MAKWLYKFEKENNSTEQPTSFCVPSVSQMWLGASSQNSVLCFHQIQQVFFTMKNGSKHDSKITALSALIFPLEYIHKSSFVKEHWREDYCFESFLNT